jgi:hypothetical protein
MRYIIGENALSSGRAERFAAPAAAEVAHLHAAIGETLRHFDAQIRAAEHELEILRSLRGVWADSSSGAPSEALNNNQCFAEQE